MALLISACVDAPAGSTSSVEVASVRYEAVWNTEGVELRDGGGWSITGDDGVTVTVDTGYLVNYQASLVPCTDTFLAELDGVDVGSTRLASHGDVADPSATPIPRVERLRGLAGDTLGDITMTSDRYCGVHYLIARGNLDTVPLPADVLMIGRTLYLSGTVTPPSGDGFAFVVDTSLAHARLDGLSELEVVGNGKHADVVIERDLARVFEGVDWQGGEAERAFQILANVTGHARIRVELGD